jgi:hypothetical protein
MRNLDFSLPEIEAQLFENEPLSASDKIALVLNVDSQQPLANDSEILLPRESSLFKNITASQVSRAACVTSLIGYSGTDNLPKSLRDKLVQSWDSAYDIFQLNHLKETQLYRSPKQRLGEISYNLWFAAAGTDCGIHNEHDFVEVHTQIWGLGHMQKFRDSNPESLYQDVTMSPGFTHRPFCNEQRPYIYPHHRYLADTDCIWLAVEYYK